MSCQPSYADGLYYANENVTMTAQASEGYTFDRWMGDVAGITDVTQSIVSVVMDNSRAITANFSSPYVHYSVTATSEPSNGGSVRLQPAQPSGGYAANQEIAMSAVPQTGYIFSHWNGDPTDAENPKTLLLGDNMVITATFNPTVTICIDLSDTGSVALEPAQPPDGYVAGTEVTISATPAKDYRLASWGGSVSGSGSSITVTVDEPKTIIANFVKQSSSRWWLWMVLGLGGLFGALVLVRLVYVRMNRQALDEPLQPHE